MTRREPREAIAIVGMAGRFPGASSVARLWANLEAGRESIRALTEEELRASNIDSSVLADPRYVRARAILEDVDLFDASFFGMTPREADLTDPQHRLFLETCWSALEDAGCDPETFGGSIGVFGGMSMNTYLLAGRRNDARFWKELTESYQIGSYPAVVGNDFNFLTTRVSYKLNLKGPSLDIQTGCSTSLVAVCLASRSLLQHDCDAALAGGVSVTFPQERGYLYQEGAMGSADGHCRPFDASAAGTVFGGGVGVVVLKRLSDALSAGDSVVAVIRGFALNNDGASKVGYMAPSVEGQAEVIAAAQAAARVEPRSIGYVEAHGTGTPLGDPIEIASLTRAFGLGTADRGFCAIGSVKGNVGHLDVASGVTGLIKAALVVRTGRIPASLHFERPNPAIDFESSPFFVNARSAEWRADGPRRAGVSAFGVGGTNAHVILEEPPQAAAAASRSCELLVLSARTGSALDSAAMNLSAHLSNDPQADLGRVAWTLQSGRRRFPHRRTLVCSSREEAISALARPRREEPKAALSNASVSVAFLFPGQGSQHPGMAGEIFDTEPVFREAVERCCARLDTGLRRAVLEAIRPPRGGVERLPVDRTSVAQPALFVVEYALARLWESWGVRPVAMAGHSVGEFVAAALANVFSMEDALHLVAERGRLIEGLPAGAMVAVRLDEQAAVRVLRPGVSLAAVNGPSLCVLSGGVDAMAELEEELARRGVARRRLPASHAFHSEMMDPVLERFGELVGSVARHEPALPFVSGVTGTWIRPEEAVDPAYWTAHLRRPVRFAPAVGELLSAGATALLEVGPGQTLSPHARRHPARKGEVVLASLRHPEEGGTDRATLLSALGRLWKAGAAIDWPAVQSGRGLRRVSLPGHPLEKRRHWLEAPPGEASPAEDATAVAAEDPPESGEKRPRRPGLLARIQRVFADLSGIPAEQILPATTFLESGFDSLFLTQAAQQLQKEFGIRVAFRQLLGDASTPESLAGFLDSQLPADPQPAAPAEPRAIPPAAAADPPGTPGLLERVMTEQLRIMSQQLAMLRGEAAPASPAPMPLAPLAPLPEAAEKKPFQAFGPYKPIERSAAGGLTPRQQTYLSGFVERYTRRTARSKQMAEEHRSHFADPRVVAGFRQEWKEIVYPIVAAGSSGSKIFDVDGNEYVDLLMGFGLNLFGHSPPFVTDAIREQLVKGVEIGPQSPIAGEVALRITELTGMDRVTFCNTGSEAVMAAVRLARTVTGRDRVALFTGSYHGTFDEVLVRGVRAAGSARSFPIAPGIPSAKVENVLVLDYGTDESLTLLESRMGDLAAVLVEPVQSRHPDLQPREFLRELRKMTEKAGTALIFDEVITGFRVHPGGAQAWFDVKADIATYGKVLGGGLPLGVVAGRRAFMDALDGGMWRFGDDSVPEVGVTFFAGTFVRHPLAMAAARAVLRRLQEAGPALQEGLNDKAGRLAARINEVFDRHGVPSHVENFGSILYFAFPADRKPASLLYYHLREKGVHAWEGFPCFVTEAHSEEDLDFVVRAFEASARDMREGGLLGEGSHAADAPAGDQPAAARAEPRIPVRDAPDGVAPDTFPLTDSQKEVWLACQMGSQASCAFNEGITLRLDGRLDVSALARALRQVVERHDALRTTFEPDGERARVGPAPEIPLPVIDLSDCKPADAELRLRQVVREEGSTPFDLVHGPLLRVTLVKLETERHAVVWTAHHLAADGWSVNVVLDELASLYTSHLFGRTGAAVASAKFADYAAAEHERRGRPEAAATDAYWVSELTPLPPVLELPADRPRPALKTYSGSTVRRSIAPSLVREVRRAGAREGCTLFATLLAGFAALLHRLSGQDDLVVGIPAAGQASDGHEDLVGHCVQFLPVRSRLTRAMVARDYLQAMRRQVLEGYEHQDSTYGRLVRKLPIPRDPARLPLVEAQFNLERLGTAVEWEGLSVSVEANPKAFVHDDLFLNVVESDAGLLLDCDFNTDLFDAATIERWLEYFENLLAGIAADASQRITALPLWGEAERKRVLEEWNRTARPFSISTCAHELVEGQAARTPTSIAVSFLEERLTYADLNARANRLAHRLVELGVASGSVVGVCLRRSLDLPVALLAVGKAGGAYLPLDPSHPRDRVSGILSDAGVSLLVVDRGYEAPPGLAVLDLDAEREVLADRSPENPAARATSDDLAYVMYTSGSTGQPKGVAVTHRSLVNLLGSMRERPGIGPQDVLFAVTTVSFDIATLELLLPLTAGGRVAIAPEESVSDGARLAEELFRSSATILQATPTTWRLLVDSGWKGQSNLKMLCGGEPLSRELADVLLSRGASLWNMYGPTETTIWSAAGRIAAGTDPPPVGPPIANTRIYILDEERRPVPIGVRGELFIAGEGLARGYWNRPDWTQASFVSDPFQQREGERLYRTGDVGRFRPDGRIELAGRSDRQVKLRGHRIELGEVEAALARHPDVREAAAVVREDVPGERRLVGYVVARPGESGKSLEAAWQEEMQSQWEAQYGSSGAKMEPAPAGNMIDASLELYSWAGLANVREELDAWLAPTARELLSWKPRRVLEIGCGTGLVLERLAASCEGYVGTDFSSEALAQLRDRLESRRLAPGRVELLCRNADDFDGLPDGAFDLVVINSVVEYLPGVESLLRVLDGAVAAAGPDGRVFIGDVPSLPMWDIFHAAMHLERAPDALSVARLAERIEQSVSEASRLLVDPDLFRALRHRHPGLRRVEVRLSRAKFSSPESRLHADAYYDVVLYLGRSAGDPVEEVRIEWGGRSRTLAEVEAHLTGGDRPVLLSGVPLARTVAQASALVWIESPSRRHEVVADLRRDLAAVRGEDLAGFERLAARLGCTLDRVWSGSGRDGACDLLFRPVSRNGPGLSRDVAGPRPWAEYTNAPARAALARRLVPGVRSLARRILPAPMVPAAIEVLDALPLTGNGKVDHAALPAPRGIASLAESAFVAPRDAREQTLATIWAEVLRLDRVGIRDDVFDLGGDSLLIFQIITRAHRAGFDLTPRDLFEHRTIEELVEVLAKKGGQARDRSDVPLLPAARDAHRVSRASL